MTAFQYLKKNRQFFSISSIEKKLDCKWTLSKALNGYQAFPEKLENPLYDFFTKTLKIKL